MQVFIDTNILVYATIMSAPMHLQARQTLLSLQQQNHDLWISRQVIREYLTVVSRPQSYMQPLTSLQAAQSVMGWIGQFYIADETQQVSQNLLNLMQKLLIAGKQIHDANIVATMLSYNIAHLLTHNVTDFVRYSTLISVMKL